MKNTINFNAITQRFNHWVNEKTEPNYHNVKHSAFALFAERFEKKKFVNRTTGEIYDKWEVWDMIGGNGILIKLLCDNEHAEITVEDKTKEELDRWSRKIIERKACLTSSERKEVLAAG